MQWLSENLYKDNQIKYFESCNQESIKNSVATFIDMKLLEKRSVYITLSKGVRKNEKELDGWIEKVKSFRALPQGEVTGRKQMLNDYPFMAKL